MTSPDTIIRDPMNPQAFNRYSYCLNNPLKYIDPSGKDTVIVLGTNSPYAGIGNYNYFWNQYAQTMGSTETFVWLPDIDPEPSKIFEYPDINPRLEQLTDRLELGDLTDIKIIGFSEGAATVGQFMSDLADNPYSVSENVRNEIRSATLLECPTGASDFFVHNWDDRSIYYLPQRIEKAGLDIKLSDQWNMASVVHASGTLPGWDNNSIAHDSRSITQNRNLGGWITRALLTGDYHVAIWYMYQPIPK